MTVVKLEDLSLYHNQIDTIEGLEVKTGPDRGVGGGEQNQTPFSEATSLTVSANLCKIAYLTPFEALTKLRAGQLTSSRRSSTWTTGSCGARLWSFNNLAKIEGLEAKED